MSRSAEFDDGSRLESLYRTGAPEALVAGLSPEQREIFNRVRSYGTVDAARTIHNAAHGSWELGTVNSDLDLDTVHQKDVDAVSAHIKGLAHKSLTKAGFGDTFSVWRTGDLRDEVVPVTTTPGGIGFKGETREYKVHKSNVLTHGEGFLGRLQTFAENEMHVHAKDLIPVETPGETK